jgi:NAD(P)-dependent dehydrogenase (short-subunit alcohol dehydrogenase family)
LPVSSANLSLARRRQPLPKSSGRRRAANLGIIVHVAGVFAAATRVAAYATSEAWLLNRIRVMAVHHAADSMRCNVVGPGLLDTPMLRYASRNNNGLGRDDDVVASRGAVHQVGPRSLLVPGASFIVNGDAMVKLGTALLERAQ